MGLAVLDAPDKWFYEGKAESIKNNRDGWAIEQISSLWELKLCTPSKHAYRMFDRVPYKESLNSGYELVESLFLERRLSLRFFDTFRVDWCQIYRGIIGFWWDIFGFQWNMVNFVQLIKLIFSQKRNWLPFLKLMKSYKMWWRGYQWEDGIRKVLILRRIRWPNTRLWRTYLDRGRWINVVIYNRL